MKNNNLLKSKFFTIAVKVPSNEDLNLIFAGVCKDFASLTPSHSYFTLFFEEFMRRVRQEVNGSLTISPDYLFSPDEVSGIEVRQVCGTGNTQQPSRSEMLEYIKAAIGEGYQPENEEAITNLSLIDALNDNGLNREFGKCWQWYNMGGGMHETFEKQVHFEEHKEAVIQAVGHKAIGCQKVKGAADTDEAKSRYDYSSFKSASKPLVKWLNENANPHATVIVEVDGATLYSAESHAPVREFLKD